MKAIVLAAFGLVGCLLPRCDAAQQTELAPSGHSPPSTHHSPTAIDFETEIIPVLTKTGCNSGACHGAAIGRGGFKLSLLGYDPQADYDTLVNEFEGRRVNRAHPAKSLLLRKPLMDVDHEGGLQLTPGGDGFRILHDWLAGGAPRGPARRLVDLEVAPTSQWLPAAGEKFSVRVTARFARPTISEAADNSQLTTHHSLLSEDVTRWAVFTPADAAAVRVDSRGEITALARGQSSIMIRFLGGVAAVTVTVPISDSSAAPTARPRANFIDDHVNRTLNELRLPHSPQAEAATLARRVFLDVLGTLPDPAETDEFIAGNRLEDRGRLIERLMDRPEFADLWSYKWGDLLRIESRRLQPEGAAAFHRWIHDCVAKNTSLDVMAREMLLSLGDAHQVGPANFSRVPADARTQAEHVSRVFLGVRLQCANCHNHPLDRWTQDDYHGLAAVFARLDRGRDLKLLPRGDVIHPKTGQPAAPRIPGVASIHLPVGEGRANPLPDGEGTEPRERLASWLTSPGNPFFARAAVNRIWRELMGRGLVEPIDDHRATNPATHPELLDALARDFVAHGFDMRHTIRTIVASEAYQRSSRSVSGNETDDRFYSKSLVRPLAPHVLVDAVAKVTGVPEKLGELPPGATAISLGDSRVASEPLDLLGRCARDAECTASSNSAGSLPLTLHTINGPWLNGKIADTNGRLTRLLEEDLNDERLVQELFQLALARKPTARELDHWRNTIRTAGSGARAAIAQDFLWAMLNSIEFCCNH